MSEFETELYALKHKLESAKWAADYHNKFADYHNKIANKIEEEISALEKANTPKLGDIYKNVYRSTKYIVAGVGHEGYCLINLTTGTRYSDPVPSILNIFGRYDSKNLLKEFVKSSL